MKKLFLIFVLVVATMALATPIVSAQTPASAGCTTYASGGAAVPANFSATFAVDEVIAIVVTSADGGVFDVTVGGNLLLDDAATGASTSYTVTVDGAITIDIAVTGGTGTYTIACTPAGEDSGAFDGTLCHYPPGNPDAAHTITVGSQNAVDTHVEKHGDTLGACPAGVQTRSDNFDVNITIFVIFATDSIQVYGNCTDECQEIMNTPIVLIIDLKLVIIHVGNSSDDDDQDDDSGDETDGDEFMQVENPEDYGFVLGEIDQDGLYVVIYYLHPDPNDASVGVFQINVYDSGTLLDDSILVFINISGDIVLWTDHSYWDQQDDDQGEDEG